ncbi:PucR family transcriptional regulator ligand-binding domain-containing protein, partial [Candidatus Bathyarchaeota archaeon]|nr:PucR family transcriptional regulator ligand-binding domain-containing protein [Candidatus Bathyarchaeota archaeon]
MISVREMLKLPALSGSYLLAGQNGLDRKIKYLDILEVPDAENWLAPDEFLLTTAFAFKDSEDGLKKIITAGADKKVAGFGIKLGRYINVLPEQVIQIANSYSMPIISLPTHIPYVEIIKEVMSKIIKSEENTEKSIKKTDLLIQLINDETETAFDELESFGWERGTPIRIGLLSSSPCFSDEEIALFRY